MRQFDLSSRVFLQGVILLSEKPRMIGTPGPIVTAPPWGNIVILKEPDAECRGLSGSVILWNALGNIQNSLFDDPR